MDYQKLAKAELHVHLDGSLRDGTLLQLHYNEHGSHLFASRGELHNALCFRKGWDLQKCLKSFDVTLSVLQTTNNLLQVTKELCEDLAFDGVTYAEIRYCPTLHTQKGLKAKEVVSTVGTVLQSGNHGLKARQIITALRNLGPEHALQMARLAASTRGAGVVGFDLAGDEYNYPPELFTKAFTYARDQGIPITIHAGEGHTEQLARNVRTAVTLGAQRIGHGVAGRLDDAVMDLLAENGIVVEICPTSNIHTGSIGDYKDHPARLFYDRGIKVVPCADNTFLSLTNTSVEYRHLAEQLGFTEKELKEIAAQSLTASFINRH